MSRFLTFSVAALGAVNALKLKELTSMSDTDVEALFAKTFPLIDTNGDGHIDASEIVNYNEKRFLETLREAARSEFGNLDKDGNGLISFEELTSTLAENVPGGDLQKRFSRSDKDGDGFLNLDEVLGIMLGTDIDESIYTDFITQHDTDKDGKLTVEELLVGFSDEELKQSGEDVHAAFKFADTNSDNLLDASEVKILLDTAASGGTGTKDQRKAYFEEEAKQVLSGEEKLSLNALNPKSKIVLLADLFDEEAMESVQKEEDTEAGGAPQIPADLEADILRFQAEMMKKGDGDPTLDPSSDSFDVDKFLKQLQELSGKSGNDIDTAGMSIFDEEGKKIGSVDDQKKQQAVSSTPTEVKDEVRDEL